MPTETENFENTPPAPPPPPPATPPPATRPRHVVFVCTGNICRSPMAEALLRHALKAEQPPLRDLPVISCATTSWEVGNGATENAVLALRQYNIDLSSHCSQEVSDEIVDNAVAIFAMTGAHLYQLRAQFGKKLPADTYLLRGLLPATDKNAGKDIDDPYGYDLQTYKECRDDILAAIPSILKLLREKVK